MKLGLGRYRLALLVSVPAISLFFTVAPAAAAVPPANGASSNQAVAQLIAEAKKAIREGKLPLAVIHLKNASSADPRNGPVRAQLGIALLQTGDFYAAERELRQARKDGASDEVVLPSLFQTMFSRNEEKVLLNEFPEPSQASNAAAEILKARAQAFLNLGRSGDAIDSMDKSLKLRRDAPGLLLRARIAKSVRAFPSAMQFISEAIAMAPDSVGGLLFKADLLRDSGDVNGALTLAEQLAAKFPTNRVVQFERVGLLIQAKKYDQAKAGVDAVLAEDPGNFLGIYYRAILIWRSGDAKGAWRIAQSLPQEFLRAEPTIALSTSQLADAAGNSETAAAILDSAIGRFPQDQDARLRGQLAQLKLRQNDIKGALAALEPLRSDPDPLTAQRLAALYIQSGRAGDAIEVLQKLSQSGKGTDATTLQLFALEEQIGQSDQALKYLTAMVKEKPTHAALVQQLVVALTMRGRFTEALAVADALGIDPAQRITSLVLRGEIFLNERKPDLALASYARALQIDGKSQIALYGRASVLEGMQRFGDAAKDLQVILKLNPRNGAAYLKLAEIAARQNQDGKVREVLAQAARQLPQDPAPRLAMARYLLGRNDRSGALNTINDLLKSQPHNAEGVAMLGGIQLSMQKKTDAVATFRRLVKLNPRAPGSQILLANALYSSGDKGGAKEVLKSAAGLWPASSDVRVAQINMFFGDKDMKGAIAAAQAYQNANPGMQADILLGDTFTRAGRLDQAGALYKAMFTASPNNDTLLRIARNFVMGGDLKSAVEILSPWVEKNPQDRAVRLAYATLLMQQKDNAAAIRQFREVLKDDPNNVACLNNLAWLTQEGDPSGASALATRAVVLAPDSAEALDTLGWIKLKHGKATDSLPLLKRAHEIRRQDGEISYHLALSLEATGSHDAARGFLKALLSSQVKFADREEAAKLAETWH